MTKPNNHIIQKQKVSLTLRESKDSAAIQQRVSKIVQEKINPLLDQVFSRLAGEDEIIRVDALEIDIGTVAPDRLEEELAQKVVAAIEQKLKTMISTLAPGVKQHPLRVNRFEAFLSFLEKGTLPWQLENTDSAVLEKSVLETLSSDAAALHTFQELLLRNPVVTERLIRQSEESFLAQLMQACFGGNQIPFVPLREKIAVLLETLPTRLLQKLFYKNEIAPRELFLSFWRKAIAIATAKKQLPGKADLVLEVLKSFANHNFPPPQLLPEVDKIKTTDDPVTAWKVVLETFARQEMDFVKTAKETVDPDAKNDAGTPKEKPEEQATEKTISRKENTLPDDLTNGKATEESTKDVPDATLQKKKQTARPEAENTKDKIRDKTATVDDEIEKSFVKNKAEATTDDDEKLFVKNKAETPGEITQSTEASDEAKNAEATDFKTTPLADIPAGTSYYVSTAGMVLLHPFLTTLFDACELLENKQFKDKAAQEKAVHLLHYLVSGKTEQPEYDLVLAKFLCGLPFNFPVDRKTRILQKEKDEGMHLLQVVIDHWGALGNVKPDSLQQGFLQRDGKLEKVSGGWHLLVEKQTIDILLGKLPWGIGMIKLPWMEEVLTVEWF